LNTEIGKTGEVIVEGHAIGRLDGFTFAPDAAEAGSDAKALQAAAQQVLAREIDARAEKLSQAADEQLVLASDGTIRWTGDAVAKLTAAEDALHPRLRIIADERLAGASREKVEGRLALWTKTHIEKLLGPLFDLSKAEDVTGIARGIAFQLVEALGVIERSKIASEMKDLDQPSRATLRKYGVRFGAYHIYVPNLLKPAARALASLLWALKQDDLDPAALSGVQHLASSGRTSFPIDKTLPRDAYRLLGYRQCGERAVRVDILERLADLIRPALAWRETSPGEKPAGAFDGRGFVVTQAMTSLTGSAGEDFASVLRALGYRMERRPPPPPKPSVAEAPAAEAAPVETPAEAVAEGATSAPPEAPVETPAIAAMETPAEPVTETAEQPLSGDPAPSASVQAEVPLAPAAAEEVRAEAVSDTHPAETITPTQTERASEPEFAMIAEAVPAESAATVEAAAASAPEVQAEPALVEVWRPGGRMDERRPRHDRHRHRHQAKAGEQAAGAGEAGEGEKRERHRGHGRRNRHKDFRRPGEATPAEGTPAVAEAAPAGEQHQEQRQDQRQEQRQDQRQDQRRDRRERFEGKDREREGERRRDKFGERREKRERGDYERGGRDKRDRDKRDRESGPSHRQYATSASPRDRDRAIDPNSPFAKLAALKEQLTANRKD
jgi:ATP-dependent RNA helicase SUPV3L1/SUV3